MKKFFPLLIMIIAFLGFLTGQIFFEMVDTRAGQFTQSKEKFGLYENLYSELSLVTTDGAKHKLKEVKSPAVLLNFWASWCQPCLKEFPTLNALREKFKPEELLILGINNDEENQDKLIKKIESEYALKFKSVKDANNEITSKFHISEIPISILYVKGKVVDVFYGESDFSSDSFASNLKEALAR
ncbi:MAG: TlpA family protein disulfide reductase [Bacteriovoracaceae bacterium]|nr:TlpA family protein disulfide reductase [Bacteriovoracaceae bacterium]